VTLHNVDEPRNGQRDVRAGHLANSLLWNAIGGFETTVAWGLSVKFSKSHVSQVIQKSSWVEANT